MPALSKVEICELLPHGETMCLLDVVESWDSSGIVCVATSHREKNNPLRNKERLHSICGLEYAAQAMGVHVSLTFPPENISSTIGYLGGVRELQMGTSRLDSYSDPLTIIADLLFSQTHNFMYYFNIVCHEKSLLSGRASIFIQQRTS